MPTPRFRISRPRRGAAVVALVAATAVLVGGCGATAEVDAASTDAAGYTVEHAMGQAQLPATPERIVVLDSPHLDALVSLGITPVGASTSSAGSGFPPYLADKLDGVEEVGTISEPNLEKIALLDPDLIIGAKVRHEAVYTQLNAIAPTVFSEGSGTNWHEQAEITAAAVDRSDEMADILAALSERATQVGEQIGAEGKTASMVRFRPDNFRLYGPESFSGSLLTEVGFDLGAGPWNEYSMQELSHEELGRADGQVIFYTDRTGQTDATTGSPIWATLPAVQTGQAFEVEDEIWMVGIGVLGANTMLDQLAEIFA